MKTAAGIGDNCIDDYTNIGRRYPTGNVVDTGVNLQKLGIPTAIISTTGSDENGKWMIEALTKEGLDLSHLKVAEGKTAITYMTLDENDRVHGEYEEGVLENIVFDEEDIRFAAEHDLVFTAFWGKAEHVMGKIHDLGAITAFDTTGAQVALSHGSTLSLQGLLKGVYIVKCGALRPIKVRIK